MSHNCGSYKERLSAYLDGNLPPEEMAEISAHLKICPECLALLEKMKRLDRMASDSLPEFDDSVLNELEKRITDEIDRLPETSVSKEPKKPKIIPIWYRYAAAAASIVFVFLIGRMAYEDSARQFVRPVPAEPTYFEHRRVESSPQKELPPEDLSDKGKFEKRKAIKEEDKEPSVPERPIEKVDLTSPSRLREKEKGMERRKVRPEIETKPEAKAKPGIIQFDKEPVTVTEGETETINISKSIAVRGRQEKQIEEPREGVPADTRSRETGKASYAPIQERDRIEANEVSPPDVVPTSALEDMADMDAAMLKKKDEKAGLEHTGERLPAESSLESFYVSEIASAQASMSGHQYGKTVGGGVDDSLTIIRILLKRIESRPEADTPYDRIISIYMEARANYDLYRFTGDNSCLSRTSDLREAALEIIRIRQNKGSEDPRLMKYMEEINRWDISE